MSHLSVKNWAHPCAPASSASGGLCKTRAASGKWWCSFPQHPPFLHERSFWGSARPWCYGSLVLPLSVHLAFPPSSRVCCYVFLEEAYGVKYKISACWNRKPTGFLWFPSAEVLGPSPWSRGQFCGCTPPPPPGGRSPLCRGGPKATWPNSQAFCSTAALKGFVCASCSTLFLLWKKSVKGLVLLQPAFSFPDLGYLYILPQSQSAKRGMEGRYVSSRSPCGHGPHSAAVDDDANAPFLWVAWEKKNILLMYLASTRSHV